MNDPEPSKRKSQPRYARLDGKPPLKPRGRHTGTASTARETVTLAPTARLGFRISEFAHLCGVSIPTVWRQVRDKKIETVEIGGVRLIPRAYAIKRGLITTDDTI